MIALYVHPKNSNHLRSHWRAIMALDHSRSGLENEFLENKSRRIFGVQQVYLTKSYHQIWVRVNQHFILFIRHTWDETVIWGAVFIIQTSDKMQYFTIFQDKYSEPSKHAWAFSKTVQKIWAPGHRNLLGKLKKVRVIGSLRQITGNKEIRKWGWNASIMHTFTVSKFCSLTVHVHYIILLYGYNSTCTLIGSFLVLTRHYFLVMIGHY